MDLLSIGGSIIGKAAGWVGEKLGGVQSAIDLLPDSPEKAMVKLEAQRAANELSLGLAQAETERQKSLDELRIAETKSENWLTANHRPLAIIALVAVVFFNYGVAPHFGRVPTELPAEYWWMSGALIGVKFAGRTMERINRQNGRKSG